MAIEKLTLAQALERSVEKDYFVEDGRRSLPASDFLAVASCDPDALDIEVLFGAAGTGNGIILIPGGINLVLIPPP